jgi:hypothetical protein
MTQETFNALLGLVMAAVVVVGVLSFIGSIGIAVVEIWSALS